MVSLPDLRSSRTSARLMRAAFAFPERFGRALRGSAEGWPYENSFFLNTIHRSRPRWSGGCAVNNRRSKVTCRRNSERGCIPPSKQERTSPKVARYRDSSAHIMNYLSVELGKSTLPPQILYESSCSAMASKAARDHLLA